MVLSASTSFLPPVNQPRIVLPMLVKALAMLSMICEPMDPQSTAAKPSTIAAKISGILAIRRGSAPIRDVAICVMIEMAAGISCGRAAVIASTSPEMMLTAFSVSVGRLSISLVPSVPRMVVATPARGSTMVPSASNSAVKVVLRTGERVSMMPGSCSPRAVKTVVSAVLSVGVDVWISRARFSTAVVRLVVRLSESVWTLSGVNPLSRAALKSLMAVVAAVANGEKAGVRDPAIAFLAPSAAVFMASSWDLKVRRLVTVSPVMTAPSSWASLRNWLKPSLPLRSTPSRSFAETPKSFSAILSRLAGFSIFAMASTASLNSVSESFMLPPASFMEMPSWRNARRVALFGFWTFFSMVCMAVTTLSVETPHCCAA